VTEGAALGVNESQVMGALRHVVDPELAIDVVELGMVGDIEIESGSVLVNMRLTSMSCPFWDLFVEQVKGAVGDVAGVDDVAVRFDRRVPWRPELMTDAARAELEAVGLMPPSLRPDGAPADRVSLIRFVDGVLSAPRPAGHERGSV
jgi:metal-sulfur cluster biosynthetic enzyme